MHDLTGFQRDLLYTIAGQEEPHGLAIKDELEDYYETEIHHGRLGTVKLAEDRHTEAG
jgi:DNA-binding PadR family transcriptional regulator